jgi:DNA-binding transcriptional LysR family regulator
MHINFMRYSWNHIRTFLAVAQTGSLSATARALQITQPTVGRCIDLLEDALKMALFVRSREGMSLTQILNLGRTLPAGNGVYNSTA